MRIMLVSTFERGTWTSTEDMFEKYLDKHEKDVFGQILGKDARTSER